ncbi:YhdT family protein [Mitsuokella sp.]|uniref:YhdT family protein n=1 Tax=unclassified Mitsuokella TaxID=2637239 RepID=UPI003D7EB29D
MNNYEKYRQVQKEAAATGLLLLILIGFWVFAGFGLASVSVEIFHLPLWVWTATIGVWLFAILGVKILTATVFEDMSLEDEEAGHDDK